MTWHVYRDDHTTPLADDEVDAWLQKVPPWRTPPGKWDSRRDRVRREPAVDPALPVRARSFRLPPAADRGREIGVAAALDRVNAALLLRRPLLVTGDPGVGKSSLAWHLAWALGLGRPLVWEIGSRTTLAEGLYHYDAVGHLQATRAAAAGDPVAPGRFVTLGPLGTALLPTRRPRVLLVDELDKSGYDLPNDLLHVFEEGRFRVPELKRVRGRAEVFPNDAGNDADTVPVLDGEVARHHAPVVVITSNGDREFPEAFLRRCVQLELGRPTGERLRQIVDGWFGAGGPSAAHAVAAEALLGNARLAGQATDVALQALFLAHAAGAPADTAIDTVRRERRG